MCSTPKNMTLQLLLLRKMIWWQLVKMVLGQFFTTNNAWYACFFPKWPSARKMKKHEILDHHYLSCNFSVQYGNLPAWQVILEFSNSSWQRIKNHPQEGIVSNNLFLTNCYGFLSLEKKFEFQSICHEKSSYIYQKEVSQRVPNTCSKM